MAMYFFENHEPPEIPFMEELGLRQIVDGMKARGHRCAWVTKVYGPEQGAIFHPGSDKWHGSDCPHFEGYWWAGGFGAVQCRAAGGLLPGTVHDTRCEKCHRICPYYKKYIEEGRVNQ